jgi:hypothetical protein
VHLVLISRRTTYIAAGQGVRDGGAGAIEFKVAATGVRSQSFCGSAKQKRSSDEPVRAVIKMPTLF